MEMKDYEISNLIDISIYIMFAESLLEECIIEKLEVKGLKVFMTLTISYY